MVETDTPDTVFVKYWLPPETQLEKKTSFYKEVSEKRQTFFVHRIFLSDLITFKEYQYSAMQEKGQTIEGKFRTAPDTSGVFRFAVVADTQSNPEIHSAIAIRIKKLNPSLVIYAGDMTESGTYNEWIKDFFTEDAVSLLSGIPFTAAIGNHDALNNDYKAFLQFPRNSGNETYGSFDIGKAHVLILNTELSLKVGSAQFKFAEKDLKQSKSKWKIVVQHKPVYSPRKFGTNKDFQYLSDSVFVPNRVDFVLSGHVHFYQRNLILGLQHLILGGGGGNLLDPKKIDETVFQKSQFHFAIIEVDQYSIFVKIYSSGGEIIDSFEVVHYY